jgi:NADPH-dependent ferric siderophore reductase
MLNHELSGRPDLNVTRIRHPLKLRLGQVTRIEPITPQLTRITLAGEDLRDFVSASFDDHVKVFFPAEGAVKPVLPALGPGGPSVPGADRPIARDFTPRRFDPRSGELDIEFALHDAGPATTWASRAQVGHYLGIGGPRGSMIIPESFDWHLLIGDDTALPAIARRLEELPSSARAIVVAEVENSAAHVDFKSSADVQLTWCYRSASNDSSLLSALRNIPPLPSGEGYAWAAAESAIVRRVREHLVNERGVDKSRVRAAAYWKSGLQAIHEVIED